MTQDEISQQLRYFVDPIPPNQFEVTERDTRHISVRWEHRECYSEYKLKIIHGDEEREETVAGVEGAALEDSKQVEEEFPLLEHQLVGLEPCTQYALQLRSVSEDGRHSEHYSPVTVYTEHPENINLTHYVDYTQVRNQSIGCNSLMTILINDFDIPRNLLMQVIVNVTLHGTDCVSKYKLSLCDNKEGNECEEQTFSESGSYIFAGLDDGTYYSYQLEAFDGAEVAVFTSPEVLVKTRLVVTANTTLASVTPDTATFHFWTSIFEDLKEDEIEFTATMQCTRVSGKVIEESKQYCF